MYNQSKSWKQKWVFVQLWHDFYYRRLLVVENRCRAVCRDFSGTRLHAAGQDDLSIFFLWIEVCGARREVGHYCETRVALWQGLTDTLPWFERCRGSVTQLVKSYYGYEVNRIDLSVSCEVWSWGAVALIAAEEMSHSSRRQVATCWMCAFSLPCLPLALQQQAMSYVVIFCWFRDWPVWPI
jgi:hypothetical protein